MRRILTEKHGNRPPQYSEKIDQNWAFDLVLTVLCVYHHSRSRTAKGSNTCFSSRAAWGSSPSCYFHRRTGILNICFIKYFSQIHTWRVWKHAWTIFNVITPPTLPYHQHIINVPSKTCTVAEYQEYEYVTPKTECPVRPLQNLQEFNWWSYWLPKNVLRLTLAVKYSDAVEIGSSTSFVEVRQALCILSCDSFETSASRVVSPTGPSWALGPEASGRIVAASSHKQNDFCEASMELVIPVRVTP